MDVEFKDEVLERKRKKVREIGDPPGLKAPIDSDVAGLSVTAGMDESRTVMVAGHSTAAGVSEKRAASMAGHSVIADVVVRRAVTN